MLFETFILIEDITLWREDMNFMVEWHEKYLSHQYNKNIYFTNSGYHNGICLSLRKRWFPTTSLAARDWDLESYSAECSVKK